jgi:hypothetical protein
MWSVEVVEVFPLTKLGFEIDVILVGQELKNSCLSERRDRSTFPFNCGVPRLM